MDVFVADLHEAGAGFGEEFAGEGEAVAQVGEVGVDAELPCVAEGFDLFGFAREVFGFVVADGAFAGRGLPIGAELDAVGRVDVNHGLCL